LRTLYTCTAVPEALGNSIQQAPSLIRAGYVALCYIHKPYHTPGHSFICTISQSLWVNC